MNNEFEERGYELIDLNLGYEDLIVKTFEGGVKLFNIQHGGDPSVSPPPLEIWMEVLSSIVHRDYTTPIVEKEIGLNYGFADSDSKLDDATQMMRLALPRILRAAEYENSILELARSLEKTQRLLNALDYVIIPGYDESIKYISSILEEREREDFTRLKHVKKVLERKRWN